MKVQLERACLLFPCALDQVYCFTILRRMTRGCDGTPDSMCHPAHAPVRRTPGKFWSQPLKVLLFITLAFFFLSSPSLEYICWPNVCVIAYVGSLLGGVCGVDEEKFICWSFHVTAKRSVNLAHQGVEGGMCV